MHSLTVLSASQLLVFGGSLFVAGAIAGVTAGLLGVGGGIVIVPVLWHLFTALDIAPEVRMHLAVWTSLATVVTTSLSSIRAHYRRDMVDTTLLRAWGPWIFAGVIAGTAVVGVVRGPTLTAIFASVAAVVAWHIGFAGMRPRESNILPRGAASRGLAATIGAISAMMGIGGGTLSVPILTFFGYPIHRAVGTAAAIGFIIGIPGSVGFVISGWSAEGLPPLSLGYVSVLGFVLIAPSALLCAPWGAYLAHVLKTNGLRRVFAVFLGITAIRMFWDLLT